MKKFAVFLAVFGLAVAAHGAFKDVNWSVRSSGMGGAFVAIADDASGPLVNPAGMIQVEGGQADFMYSKLFTGLENVDLALQYASFVHEAGKAGSVGFAYTYFETKDVYTENTISYSHAVDLKSFWPSLEGVYAGATLKYLSHRYILDQYTQDDPLFVNSTGKWALTGDVGILAYPMPEQMPGLTVGAVARNITQPDVGLDAVDRVPMETAIGAALTRDAFRLFNTLEINDAVTSLDVQYRNQDWGNTSNKVTVSLGTECWMFKKILGLRAGANSRELSGGISFDFGIMKRFGVRFDYAVNFPIYLTGTSGSHRGSLLVKF